MITKIALMFFIILFICACSPSVKFMKYSENIYTPTDSIEVLRNKPIEKNYIELGELSIKVKSGDENSVLRLVDKAKEIGANAIIILGESSEGETTFPVKNFYTGQTMFYTSVEKMYLKAIAIKYKN